MIAVAVAALGLSIPLALLGRAVLAAPDRVELVRMGTAGTAVREGRSLFDRAADGLLGVGEVDPLFVLAREYRHAASAPNPLTDSATPVRLATLARQVAPRTERSQAHVMVGAAFALPSGNGSISFERMRELGGARLLGQAVGEFREAAIIDDRNEAAKYNLELVLKSQAGALPPRSTRRGTKKTERPSGHKRHEGDAAKHPPTRRKLRQGGVYGSGKGY
jgi:hypothetical protein